MVATVFSSLRKDNLQAVLTEVLQDQAGQGQQGELVGQLLALSAAMESDDALVAALDSLLGKNSATPLAMRFGAAAGMIDALQKRNTSPERLPAFQTPTGQEALARLSELTLAARASLADDEMAEATRAAAVALLGREAATRDADFERWALARSANTRRCNWRLCDVS